jgi:hypothetical protein
MHRVGGHVNASTVMLVRFRQTAAGLQCSLVETHRINGAVRYEQVASLGSVSESPSVSERITFWRRVYATMAELANRIDAETQGKIISAVHSRVPVVTPNEQRALRVRPRPQPEKRDEGAKERPQHKAQIAGRTAAQRTDVGAIPFAPVPSLPTAKQEVIETEHAQTAKERAPKAEADKRVESDFSKPKAVEEFTTVLVHLFQYTPFR